MVGAGQAKASLEDCVQQLHRNKSAKYIPYVGLIVSPVWQTALHWAGWESQRAPCEVRFSLDQ